MDVKMIQQKDLPTIRGWYDQYEEWIAPELDALPENGLGGFVVHKGDRLIVAGYLYLTNSKMAHLEWIVGDRDYKEEDRDDAIIMLIQALSYYAQELGYKYIFACSRHENLIKKYEKVGYVKAPNKSHELILKL